MPEQAVKPRPVLRACCGQSYVWSEVIMGGGGGVTPPSTEEFLLQEGGDYILQEDGFKIKLETST